MKGELKAGGLALVIASDDKADIGKCVKLIQRVQDGGEYTAPNGIRCLNRPGHGVVWVVSGDLRIECYGGQNFSGWAVFKPENLLPIDGDDHFLSSTTGDGLTKLAEIVGYKPREVVA